jgi:hypothetical protein
MRPKDARICVSEGTFNIHPEQLKYSETTVFAAASGGREGAPQKNGEGITAQFQELADI